MNYLFVLMLLIGSLTATIGRPFQMEESNDSDLEEAEYESDGRGTADESVGDDESSQNDQEQTHLDEDTAKNRDFNDMNEGSYLQGVAEDKSDLKFSDYKTTSKDTRNAEVYDSNDEFQTPIKTRQSNRMPDDANNYKSSRIQNNMIRENQEDKIMIEPHISNDEGNLLFSDNRQQISKIDKTEGDNNEAPDGSEQSQYFKQYYNTIQTENKGIKCDKNLENTHQNLNRDRRQVLVSKNIEPVIFSNAQNGGETVEKTDSEDEEAAIKSHIKKLSSEELEDLLNSLSEEKRALLKRIIDNNADSVEDGSNNINKREITKKALEKNNFIENAQSESSNIQGGSYLYSLNTESSIAHNSETTEIAKRSDNQTENIDVTSTITAALNDSENAELNSSFDDTKQEKPDNSLNTYADDKNPAELVSNNKVTIKNENKRETNVDDLAEINLSGDDSKILESDFNINDLQDPSDQGCFCSRDEDMSQLIDEVAQLHGNRGKTYKRQVALSDGSDSIRRNLEESFPNSEAYDETGPYAYSGPLIRVKRTNPVQAMKKRAAALMPNAKVAYVPYRAENDDEDNDEGNEFDDDAFYDRTSHLSNGNIKSLEDNSASNNLVQNSRESKKNDINLKANLNYNMESGTMSLGSDTDSVLSGVEGVDDNLMYSSGVRKRRTADDAGSIQMKDLKPIYASLSTSVADDFIKGVSGNAIIAPNYQESDPFGPLPRTYEGDLGRYKRIRRVKQTRTSDEIAPFI